MLKTFKVSLVASYVCISLCSVTAYSAMIGEGELVTPEVSWYRSALPSQVEVKSRGASASVDSTALEAQATVSSDIKVVFDLFEQFRFDAALEKMRSINGLLRTMTDTQSKETLATLLDFKGIILQRKGEMLLAANAHREALDILEELGLLSSSLGVTVRNNLAVAHYLVGNYDASEKALSAIANDRGVKPLQRARAWNNRGLLFAELGLADKALVDLSHAEDDARAANASRLLAQILNNEARGLAKRKNSRRAKDAFTEALQLAKDVNDLALQAEVSDSWADMLVDEARYPEALTMLGDASRFEAKVNVPLIRVTILNNQGRAFAGLGRTAESLQSYADALALAERLSLRSLQRDILANRGRCLAGKQQLAEAIADYLAAVALAEKSREHLPGESEAGFVQSTAILYKELIALLLKRNAAGDAETAFEMLEKSRSAALQEQLVAESPLLRDAQAAKDIGGVRGALRQEAALTKILRTAQTSPSPDMANIARLQAQLDGARKQAEKALSELSERYKGRYDQFVPAAVDPKYLKDIARLMPKNALLVSYSYSDDGLYIFLVGADGKVEFRQNLSVSKGELEDKVKTYRSLITRGEGQSREALRIDSWFDPAWQPLRESTVWLYQKLLAPIADRVQTVEQIIIAPTGLLYYLPFHALGVPSESGKQMNYLALSKRVSYISHGSLFKTFDEVKRGGKGSRILAFGDVQFGSASNLDQLDASKNELKAVKDIFGKAAVVLQDKVATKQNLLRALNSTQSVKQTAGQKGERQYDFMLISTHGILHAQEPRTSYLAMEDNNRLTAQEIGSLDLRGLSLVTLSACETALAADNPGAELMSLSEYVSLAGASSVLATLWKVDDLQTANLMKSFYTQLKLDTNGKSLALQRAQTALATQPDSTHPFFWSPFILYGKGW